MFQLRNLLLFLLLAWTGSSQDSDLLEGPPLALSVDAKQNGAKFGDMPLDGRSLINSWLNKRQRTCVDAGYGPCPSK